MTLISFSQVGLDPSRSVMLKVWNCQNQSTCLCMNIQNINNFAITFTWWASKYFLAVNTTHAEFQVPRPIGNFQQTSKQQTHSKGPHRKLVSRHNNNTLHSFAKVNKPTQTSRRRTPRFDDELFTFRFLCQNLTTKRPTARKFRLNEIPTRPKKKQPDTESDCCRADNDALLCSQDPRA